MVCTVAGTGRLGFNGDGLIATESELYLVSAVRRGPDGRVYMMDFNNHRLRVIGEDGRVSSVAGNGEHAQADGTVAAVDSPLENPIDFAFMPDGRIVFVSYHDPRVLMIDFDGRIIVVAGMEQAGVVGDEGDFGPALSAQFVQLDGIAVAPDGAVYVSDSLTNRVRMVRDGMVYPVAGNGEQGRGGDGGPATQASLFWPTALAFDAEQRLLVADTRNHVVRRIDMDGTITNVVGDGIAGFAGDGGAASSARLRQPNGLAVGDDGSIYIADRANFRVRRVGPDGVIVTVAGSGTQGHAGDGGPALDAQFGYLARVASDDGALLIADQSNGRARIVTLP